VDSIRHNIAPAAADGKHGVRFEKLETLLRVALDMRGNAEGLSLADIEREYGISRRTAERMRDAIERVFPQMEQANPGELPKRWRIRAGALSGLIGIILRKVGGRNGDRKGVYVFGIRAAKGSKPLYVGQAKKQTFKKRIDQHIKYSGDFNGMLKGIKRGTPILFLIGRVGKGRQGKSNNSAIDELEIELINRAFDRNPNLHNDRRIRRPKYTVLGFGGKGKPPKEATNLKKLIGY
jgi:hypothetical protein